MSETGQTVTLDMTVDRGMILLRNTLWTSYHFGQTQALEAKTKGTAHYAFRQLGKNSQNGDAIP